MPPRVLASVLCSVVKHFYYMANSASEQDESNPAL